MFLRSKRMRGYLYWQVIETFRDDGKVRHRTVFSLGRHETREAAQAAWDEAVARGDNRKTLQLRKDGICRTAAEQEAHERHNVMLMERWLAAIKAARAIDPTATVENGRAPSYVEAICGRSVTDCDPAV